MSLPAAVASRPATRSPSYSWTHRALETSAIPVSAILAAAAGLRVLRALDDAALAWVLVGGLVTGHVVADLLGGLIHWAADTYGSEHMPVLGPSFIEPFRYHHVDPEAIVNHDFIETNGNSCIAAVPVLGAALWWIPHPVGGAGWLFAWTVLLTFVGAGVATNQFHKWAHMTSPPAPARACQQLGLILSREHHAVHHAAPYRTYYCITTGWMNRPLRKARVHEALEWLLAPFVARRTG